MTAEALQNAVQCWLESNELETDTNWWKPEEFFGDKLASYTERPRLVLTFEGDLYDVLWSWVSDTTERARLRREFEEIVKQHGFSIVRKNYTTIYFVKTSGADSATSGERIR
jgi:hypothetical protein